MAGLFLGGLGGALRFLGGESSTIMGAEDERSDCRDGDTEVWTDAACTEPPSGS